MTTLATEQFAPYVSRQVAQGQAVVFDEIIFANIPNLTATTLSQYLTMPTTEQIKHRQIVSQVGYVNNNAIVYSVTMGTEVGDFDFNFIGLLNKAENLLAVGIYTDTIRKIKNKNGVQGNAITRSILLEFTDAKQLTQISIPAESWQIDFTARLSGIDEKIRLTNFDLYGEEAFFADGLKVSRTNGNQYQINAGLGYIHGLRAELTQSQSLTINHLPAGVYADISHSATVTGAYHTEINFNLAEKSHYTDNTGVKHYVIKLADIDAQGNVIDRRKVRSEFAEKEHRHTAQEIDGLTEALDEAGKKGLPVGSIVAFPRAVTNPVGFLKCDGTTFTQSLYPDLYRVLGNKNKLPDLTRSDVGMTAYFATDNIPAGWLAFDQIRNRVTQSAYPELYRYFVAKYGSISSVPLAEDRFLRNAHGDLTVGQTQEDEIKRHTHAQTLTSDLRNDTGTTPYFDFLAEADRIAKNTQYYDERPDNNIWMMPKLTSLFATGDSETRPKSLVLKLCIKAQNSLDDVQFWVKAFGAVGNAGMMDASQIAISLQAKANLGHLHTPEEISGLQQYIAGLIGADFAQSLTDNGWQRLPNGLILQWGKMTDGQVVNFPVSFPAKCLGVYLTQITQTYKYDCALYYYNERQFRSYVQGNDGRFLAIGF